MDFLEHTCNIFTNFSHVITTKFCVSENYIHFLAYRCKLFVDCHFKCTSLLSSFEHGRMHYFLLYKNHNLHYYKTCPISLCISLDIKWGRAFLSQGFCHSILNGCQMDYILKWEHVL